MQEGDLAFGKMTVMFSSSTNKTNRFLLLTRLVNDELNVHTKSQSQTNKSTQDGTKSKQQSELKASAEALLLSPNLTTSICFDLVLNKALLV